jgi:hypothetical protein
MRYRLMATYRGVPYEVGLGPSNSDVVLFAACPPPEELGFEPATGHWRKQVIRAEIDALWESRPLGIFRGEPCIVLDDPGERLHIAYLGTDAARAAQLGYWQIDRGVFELLTQRDEVTGLTEERVDKPLRWGEQPGETGPAPTYPYGTAPWPILASAAPVPQPPPDADSPVAPSPVVSAPLADLPRASTQPPSAQPPSTPSADLPPANLPPASAQPPSTPPADLPSADLPLPSASLPRRQPPTAQPPTAQPTSAPSADLPPTPATPLAVPAPLAALAPSAASVPANGSAALATGGWPENAGAGRALHPESPAAANPLSYPAADRSPAVPVPPGPAGPANAAPTGHVPASDMPVPNTAASDLPVRNTPASDLPVRNTPASDLPVRNTPASDLPAGDIGGRAARRQRVPTREIFCELADLASIPRATYALETETEGAMCLLPTPDGFEVFNAAGGSRHEVRFFAEEEAAYFYLFGVLVAEAIRNGVLAPTVGAASLRGGV